MYPFDIEIDANRADDDQHWRIYRIHRILGYAQAIADLNKNEDFFKKIYAIYEDKGKLTITWKEKPTEEEKNYFDQAWFSIVTDYEGNPVVHSC